MTPSHQVTFQTAFFKPQSGEEQRTNPGRYGKSLAHWLAEKLKERGVGVEEVIPEDFGWVVMLSRKPFRLWLGCGNTEGSTTEWSVFPVAETTILQRLFKRVDVVPEIDRLRVHLDALIPTIPGVSDIEWES